MENTVSERALLTALRKLLPPSSLLTEKEELLPYECDGLSVYRGLPLAVVLPETVEQAQMILRICKGHQTPVIARGAGTGLAGGVMPTKGSVVVSLAKFKQGSRLADGFIFKHFP